ncbi:hypothetical protein RU639_013262 [Aspergillus parasiticus]
MVFYFSVGKWICTHMYSWRHHGDWGVSSWANRHAPWDASPDFWNLGAVVLEIVQAVRMFSGSVPPDGHYELKEHLAEIVDLFGPFPNELLAKGDQNLVLDVFGDDGRIKDAPPMNRPGLASEAFMPGLDQEDLLRHPWLDAL